MTNPTITSTRDQHPRFAFEWRGFLIKLAETEEERDAALRLRHAVFYEELLHRQQPSGKDEDVYDAHFDHLVIYELESHALVGTYRFTCSTLTDAFYTASEFAIDAFLALPGHKMEMGRACLHQDFRHRLALMALSKGFGRYAHETQSSWLFGCTSIKTTAPARAAAIVRWINESNVAMHHPPIGVHDAFAMPEALTTPPEDIDEKVIEELLPPLLRGYLRAGAKLWPVPALDQDFACIDFFTALNLSDSNSSFMGRFVRADAHSVDHHAN